jgi:hypothetical protein
MFLNAICRGLSIVVSGCVVTLALTVNGVEALGVPVASCGHGQFPSVPSGGKNASMPRTQKK